MASSGSGGGGGATFDAFSSGRVEAGPVHQLLIYFQPLIKLGAGHPHSRPIHSAIERRRSGPHVAPQRRRRRSRRHHRQRSQSQSGGHLS